MATVVINSGVVGVAGAPLEFRNRLTRDGVAYDLSGKTVTASVRKESDPYTSLGATLEDQAVTLANLDYTAAEGGVTFALDAARTTLLAPSAAVAPLAGMVENYVLQYKVVSDAYFPQALRFAVRRALD